MYITLRWLMLITQMLMLGYNYAELFCYVCYKHWVGY